MSKLYTYGRTNAGRKRSVNQDAYEISPELGYWLVVDGMGGREGGEIAVKIFNEAASEVFSKTGKYSIQKLFNPFQTITMSLKKRMPESDSKDTILLDDSENSHMLTNLRTINEAHELIGSVFQLSNRRIFKFAQKKMNIGKMACTAELLVLVREGFVLGHVGDSRTYCLRNNEFKQVTRDHSYIQDKIEKGEISPEDAKNHPLRNVILQAVGAEKEIFPDLMTIRVHSGDLFLLCSDGLTDMVSDEQVKEILDSSSYSLSQKTTKLVDLANQEGGFDNITVILIHVGEF